MRVLAIHGVNTPPDEAYGASWQHVLAVNGVAAHLEEGRWNSTGTFVGDSAFFANPHYRSEALEAVCRALLAFATRGRGVVLAHSMGTVLHEQAERFLGTGIPAVYVGSPLSNPFIVPGLRAVGLARGPAKGTRPISLWNTDDPIVGGKAKFPLPAFDEREVSVDGDAWGTVREEHAAELYLGTKVGQNALKVCWERDD